ncbi:MAG: thiol peroxidase [Gammaproteobacteria bacterium]|nr:thiol peroxidase [Gammaproteobacteria bacterium]
MKKILLATLLFSASTWAYDIQQDLPITYDLVSAGNKPVALLGNQVEVSQLAPSFKVVDDKFRVKTLKDYLGSPILLSVVPSLDTGICSMQTKRFNEEIGHLPQDVVMLTISADLPFAQKRFCKTENIDKIQTLSDSVWRDFAMNYGVLIKDMGLLTRSIFIIAPDGTIKYKEIVPQLSEHPDYDSALSALKALSEQSELTDESLDSVGSEAVAPTSEQDNTTKN